MEVGDDVDYCKQMIRVLGKYDIVKNWDKKASVYTPSSNWRAARSSKNVGWRRERDSNPRYGLTRITV